MGEQRGGFGDRGGLRKCVTPDLVGLSFAIEPYQISHMPAVDFRRRKTQLLFKRPLQRAYIAVFAKDQRKNQPVVPRTHLAIRSVVSGKCLLLPRGNIGRSPGATDFFSLVKGRSGVVNVARREQISGSKGFHRSADKHAIHDDFAAGCHILRDELMLGGHV